MASILIQNVDTLVTMNDDNDILQNADVLITDGKIAEIGQNLTAPDSETRVISGKNRVAYPGFINTHHHFYQCLTRNVPAFQNAKLFDWLTGLYEIWRYLTPEAIEASARVTIAELLLSGCTTSADHFYVFPNSAPTEFLDTEIEVAREMGMRFHAMRGSMSRSKKDGGLPPDDLVQTPDAILEDSQRVIDKYHDADPYAMTRIVLAPCSPFSVTSDLLRESAVLARKHGVHLHTHLCETLDEEQFCIDMHGQRPLDYMQDLGWTGNDVWYAHGIYFNDEEIARLGATGTGVSHCPASNLRLGSGICKVPQLLKNNVPVSLSVDGSSSNDSSNYVREMQLALLVHRVGTAVDAMPASNVLQIATRGGARILGQPTIGSLKVGSAADLSLFRLDRVEYAGAMQDPASAMLFCGGGCRSDYTIVNGDIRVENGELVGFDEMSIIEDCNRIGFEMAEAHRRNS